MNKIQVIIVSQQVLFRQGIEHSLSRTKDIQISATADVSDEDKVELSKLGFIVGEEHGEPLFHSFKFGSA